MKIKCLHGYYFFEEINPGDISRFINITGLTLVPHSDYYTFSFLDDAPRYSILGGVYLGAPATKTFEGEPWQVMRENELVYDFIIDAVVPIISVARAVQLKESNRYFVSNGLILPGSVTDDGNRVKDYAAFYLFESQKFKYSEVSFE